MLCSEYFQDSHWDIQIELLLRKYMLVLHVMEFFHFFNEKKKNQRLWISVYVCA